MKTYYLLANGQPDDRAVYYTGEESFHGGELWGKKDMTIDEVDKMIEEDKRSVGIDLACYDVDNERLHFPIKITHDEYAVYEDCSPSKSDPNQGWDSSFFWDEEGEWF